MLVALAACGAVAQTPRPTAKTVDCLNSGCHTKQVSYTFLHGPTAVSACDACHEYKDPATHTFVMRRPGRQLCDFCHIDKTGTEWPNVHEPVAKGECTSCHNPHGSETRRMLTKPSIPELCTTCHKETLNGSHMHKPAAEDCTACHSPHTAPHKKLLKMESRALCLSCHQEVGKTIATAAHGHKPAEGDCMQCHTPHASNEIKVLKSPPKDLCISCHQTVGETVAGATHPHTAATDSKSCLNCHSPHGSEHIKQLLKSPVDTCMECHKKAIVVDKTRTIAATTELTAAAFHKHGPIEKGECAGCHDVHGGKNEGLLVAPYERSFYQAYSDTAYALCFKCHDRSLVVGGVSGPAGAGAAGSPAKQTGFRNGDRNLHAVHVNKTGQGRSCRACHTVHASRFETMIADKVSFGEWVLPINYGKTITGGSCAPGCHRPATYDRVNPSATPMMPAASPSLLVPPTGPTGPRPPSTPPGGK